MTNEEFYVVDITTYVKEKTRHIRCVKCDKMKPWIIVANTSTTGSKFELHLQLHFLQFLFLCQLAFDTDPKNLKASTGSLSTAWERTILRAVNQQSKWSQQLW